MQSQIIEDLAHLIKGFDFIFVDNCKSLKSFKHDSDMIKFVFKKDFQIFLLIESNISI